MCGFAHSSLVTAPCSVTGLSASNSAAKEWWAPTGLTSATARTTPIRRRCMFISTPTAPLVHRTLHVRKRVASPVGPPHQDLSATRNGGVAGVALIAALPLVV